MPKEVGSTTKFSEIFSAFRNTALDRHIRGGVKNGVTSLYLHKGVSFGIVNTLKRIFGGMTRQDKRAEGARLIYQSLVNEYGSDVADKVLRHVAKATDRSVARLMKEGVTGWDLKLIKVEADRAARPTAVESAQKKARAGTAEKVNKTLDEWNGARDVPANTPLGKMCRDYRSLRPEQQRFVASRLRQVAVDDVMNAPDGGRYTNPDTYRVMSNDHLAKRAKHLVAVARSDDFDDVKKGFDDADRAAKQLNKALRAPRKAPFPKLIEASLQLSDTVEPLAELENVARGKNDAIMDAVGGDDKMAMARQVLAARNAGISKAETSNAYRRSMGAKGPARALLLASAMIGAKLDSNNMDHRHAINFNDAIAIGVILATSNLGIHMGRHGFSKEMGNIRHAFVTACEDVAARKGLKGGAAQREAARLQEVIATKKPGDPDFDEVVGTALRIGGLDDRQMFFKAYNALMDSGVRKAIEDRQDVVSQVVLSDLSSLQQVDDSNMDQKKSHLQKPPIKSQAEKTIIEEEEPKIGGMPNPLIT